MTRTIVRIAAGASSVLVLVLGLLVVPIAPADAATIGPSCPTSASNLGPLASFLPPYAAGTSITDLVGCGTPFTGVASDNISVEFGDLGVTDDGCSVITAVDVTVTGSPGGNGYGLLAYSPTGGTIIPLASGDQGWYQQYGAPEGNVVGAGGVNFVSQSDQPGSGSYSVIGSLDPSALTLAQLAAGDLGVAAFVIDGTPPDVIESVTVTVTTDESGCGPTTTTTTAAPTTTTTAAAAAVEVVPAFTG